MTRLLRNFLLPLLLAAFASGCNVHEFPNPGEPADSDVDITLNLDFSLELPPYKDIIYTPNTSRAENPTDFLDLRYIVNYYRIDSDDNFPQSPSGSVTVTKDEVETLNHSLRFRIAPGSYKFLVWTDFVVQNSADDRHYLTSDFSKITLNTPHSGNDDYRDAFRGELIADVDATGTTLTVDMERPMGKFRFIATDFDIFLSRAEEQARSGWEAARSDDPINAPAEAPKVNLDEYSVRFSYPMYMPHVFNMFTNRPSDSRTGVSFDGKIQRISTSEAELGFDYVFVNGKEAPYTVRVDIYDKHGNPVGSSGSINVPLKRSMLTTVKGEFLTTKASGGVGIDPGFDDDFNIILP